MLQTRTILRGNDHVAQGLIKWVNLPPEDATWEDNDFIEAQFPHVSFS